MVIENKNAEMDWIRNRKEERGDIHKYYKDAKSVISVAMNYYTGDYKKDLNQTLILVIMHGVMIII